MNRPNTAGHSRGTLKTVILEKKRRTEKRQTKEITILNDTSSLLGLVRCFLCSSAWRLLRE